MSRAECLLRPRSTAVLTLLPTADPLLLRKPRAGIQEQGRNLELVGAVLSYIWMADDDDEVSETRKWAWAWISQMS
jgi:hypothetical protein